MNHQLTLVPAPEGAPFEWLRECLDFAFPVEAPAQRPATNRRGRVVDHAPLPGFLPRARSIERRADTRSKMAVYRSATLRWNGKEVLCLIRDLSAGGMMCRSLAKPAKDDRVEIEMRSGERIAGTAAWTRDGQLGIRFDQQLDISTLLNPRTRDPRAPIQRMPRLNAGCPAALIAEDVRHSVMLLDLSQGGAKIEANGLREGEHVTLGITGLDARNGTVRWIKAGRAGIAFHNPIPFDSLSGWALERSDKRAGTDSAPV
jgi:hypothetical protein